MGILNLLLGPRLGSAVVVDPRGYLRPTTKAAAEALASVFDGMWSGAPASGWASDVVATSVTDLASKLSAVNVSQHTRIRLQGSGDWSNATAAEISDKNFIANGGSLLITSYEGNEALVQGRIQITGCQGVHVKGVTMGGPQGYVWVRQLNDTTPTRSVVIVESCNIGSHYTENDTLANLAAQGIRCEHADQLTCLNNSIRGAITPIQGRAIRRFKVHGNDLQGCTADYIRLTGVDNSFGGVTIATMYPGDENMYAWIALNTLRNAWDDPSLSAEHTDIYDFCDNTDNLGYRVLDEWNAIYGERINSGSGVAQGKMIAGIQFNNGTPNVHYVSHSNIIAHGGFNSLIGNGTGEITIERNTLTRVAQLPTGDDAYEQYQIANSQTSALSVTFYDNIMRAPSIGTGGSPVIVQDGNVSLDVTTSAAPGQAMADVFGGVFTVDGEGRQTYTFNDAGTQSMSEYRSALWAVFEPQLEYTDKGPPDPATWPVAL